MRHRFLIGLLLLVSGALYSQNAGATPEGSWVFVISEPIGATIRLNGELTEQRTPALFRLPSGDHRFELRKLVKYQQACC